MEKIERKIGEGATCNVFTIPLSFLNQKDERLVVLKKRDYDFKNCPEYLLQSLTDETNEGFAREL